MNLDIPPRLKYDGKFEECLQLSKEKAKNKKKEKKEQTALDKQIRDHVNKVNEGYNDINSFLKGIPGVGRALSGVLDTFGPYVDLA